MRIKRLLIIMLVSISVVSCNSTSEKSNKSENIGFVAKIDSTMTLSQVAKANNIGEPYLRTELGIRNRVGKNYTLIQMSKRFKFSIDDLRKIIEDRKNKQIKAKRKKNER